MWTTSCSEITCRSARTERERQGVPWRGGRTGKYRISTPFAPHGLARAARRAFPDRRCSSCRSHTRSPRCASSRHSSRHTCGGPAVTGREARDHVEDPQRSQRAAISRYTAARARPPGGPPRSAGSRHGQPRPWPSGSRGSSAIRAIPATMPSTSHGPYSAAAPPATSGIAAAVEATTGSPAAMASATGRRIPRRRTGTAMQSPRDRCRTRSSVATPWTCRTMPASRPARSESPLPRARAAGQP